MLHIIVGDQRLWLPTLALVGLGIGFIAGMFGVGGGFVLTPLLHLVFKIPMPIAVGSALCQKIGTSIGSSTPSEPLGTAPSTMTARTPAAASSRTSSGVVGPGGSNTALPATVL